MTVDVGGHGNTSARAAHDSRDGRPLVVLELPSLWRSDATGYTWQMLLDTDEAAEVISELSSALGTALARQKAAAT